MQRLYLESVLRRCATHFPSTQGGRRDAASNRSANAVIQFTSGSGWIGIDDMRVELDSFSALLRETESLLRKFVREPSFRDAVLLRSNRGSRLVLILATRDRPLLKRIEAARSRTRGSHDVGAFAVRKLIGTPQIPVISDHIVSAEIFRTTLEGHGKVIEALESACESATDKYRGPLGAAILATEDSERLAFIATWSDEAHYRRFLESPESKDALGPHVEGESIPEFEFFRATTLIAAGGREVHDPAFARS